MTHDTLIGTGVGFERTVRVTGYLTRTERMNHGKQCEVHDRVKHCCKKQDRILSAA